jgi:hypothetical protein
MNSSSKSRPSFVETELILSYNYMYPRARAPRVSWTVANLKYQFNVASGFLPLFVQIERSAQKQTSEHRHDASTNAAILCIISTFTSYIARETARTHVCGVKSIASSRARAAK